MEAICYKNTKPDTHWDNHVFNDYSNGYAYETEHFFVHIYGENSNFYSLDTFTNVYDYKIGSLSDWVTNCFGAENIRPVINNVGYANKGLWRPGISTQDEVYQALGCDKYEQRATEQALVILLTKLSELLLYIEPNMGTLNTYSHKTRELLIISCTELENQFVSVLEKLKIKSLRKHYSTIDFVRLKPYAYFEEYDIVFRNYKELKAIKPFDKWDSSEPMQSLFWYESYNKTKHHRDKNFKEASLNNVLHAITANIILFIIRVGPFDLISQNTILSSSINQMFDLSLSPADISTFYIPLIEPTSKPMEDDIRKSLSSYYAEPLISKWKTKNITL